MNSQIQLVHGEIAKQQADVLVNTTGTDVNLLAGTISYTFLEAGGKELQEDLTKACPSGLKVGDIAQTEGRKLQCQKVFHVVLKQWLNNNDEAEQILQDVVTKCLEMASKQNFRSIAFPALGSGFHRFPSERSADIMFTATETFLRSKKNKSLKKVTFVLYPGDDVLRKDFEARRDGVSAVHEHRVSKEVVLRKATGTKEVTIRAITGDLTQFEADVLVNTTQVDLNLSVGAVSGSLLDAGGQIIQDECRQQHPLGAKPGTVIQTQGGKLKCKKIYHVILHDWKSGREKAEKIFRSVVTTCLQEASRQKFTSIGFPLLGTGYAEFSAELSTKLMIRAFLDQFQNTAYTSLQVLNVVIHPKDTAIKKVVEDHLGEAVRLASIAKFIITADGAKLPVGEDIHLVSGQLVGQKDLLRCATDVIGKKAMSGNDVTYIELTSGDRHSPTPDDYHYRLVESEFYRHLSRDKVNRHIFQITKLEYVVNPNLMKDFSAAQARMPKHQAILAFCGAAKENIKIICQGGLQQQCIRKTATVSEYPRFAMQSMKKSNLLVICKILSGKVQNIGSGTAKPEPYSLAYSSDKSLVLHKDDVILPCYIMHFNIYKRFRLKDDPENVLESTDSLVCPTVGQPFSATKKAAQPAGAAQVSGVSTVAVPKMGLLMKRGALELIVGDISQEKVDVIVSIIGTDVKFLPGSVASLKTGGQELQKELAKSSPSELQVGAIVPTKGQLFQCQRLFHVVLKQWMNPNDAAEKILKTVVTNCLEMASKRQYKTIAFPALGSGVHRFPGARSADIMFTALESYLQKHEGGTSITSVKVVLDPSCDVLLRKDFEGRLGKRPVVHENTVSKEVVLKKQVGNSKVLTVKAIVGDLSKLTDDVLVNTTQTDLDLSVGAVSSSLVSAGGPVLQKECTQQHPQGVEPGTVVQTQAGKLKCKKVFHTVLKEWAKKNDKIEKSFLSVVTTCLQEASRHNLKSIAFPVLGTGYAGYPPETSVRLMMKAVVDFVKTPAKTSLEVVSVVVHYKDDAIRKILESQVEESEQRLNMAQYIVKADGSQVAVTGDTHVVAGHVVSQKNLVSEACYVPGEKKALGGNEVKHFELRPEPPFSMTPDNYHFRLVESQFYRYLMKDTDLNRHIFQLTKVEYVVNPVQVKRFRAAQQGMSLKNAAYGLPVLGFHGTSEENIKSICKEGFRQPDHPYFDETTDVGWYGNGIYFSEYPRFAMNYMQKTNKLLMCQVLKGKSFECKKSKLGAPKEPGYDCHVDPYGKEIVIYEEDCILPCYVLHFDICKRFKFKEDKKSSNDNDDTVLEFHGEMEMHKGEEFPGF